MVVVLAAYLTVYRIWIPVLFVIGFLFDYGYNHPRIALAYRPFTEWYIFPWLVVAVTVTVVYAATGIFSALAFILSLLHGMTVTCFVFSMMRRDVNSDRLGGKCTSSVQFPGLPHSTIYGLVTMVVAVLMVYPLLLVLGNTYLACIIVLVTAVTAGINTVLGSRIDRLCTRATCPVVPGFEANAHKLVLQQVGASIVHVVTLCLVLVFYGRIA
jgi:1,4-dihydroxy-2-naphthoate octaprenyltransferase